MIEVREDQLRVTTPVTQADIEKAMADELNKRVELVKLNDLQERLKQLQGEIAKTPPPATPTP